jgi:glycosyltransferase involved in cell wall biosynthesis
MDKKIKILGIFEPGFVPRGGAEIHVIELFNLLKINTNIDFEIISVDFDYKEIIDYINKLEIEYFFDKKKIVYFYREVKVTIFIVNSIEQAVISLSNFILKNKPDILYSFFIRRVCYEVFSKFNIPVIYFAYLGIIKPWTVGNNSVLDYIYNQKNIYVSSKFIKSYFQRVWNKEVLLFTEFIDKRNYLSEIMEPKYITFINPCKEKGLDIFIKIVNILKNKTFLVVGSWMIDDEYKKAINILRKFNNVVIYNPTSDMKKVYKETKILLVPSIQEEGFGRVIIEAGINKIPVIASNRGAINEVLNDKGIIISIENNNIYDWVNSINNIENNYFEFSKKSYDNYLNFQKKLDVEINNFKKFIFSLLN